MPNGFALALAFDTKVPAALNGTPFKVHTVVYPFGVPVPIDLNVTANLNAMLHAHAKVAYDAVKGLVYLPGGSYLDVGLQGSLTATGQVGWFGTSSGQNPAAATSDTGVMVPSIILKDKATVTLNADAQAHFGGAAGNVTTTNPRFTGRATFSDRLDLVFMIGDNTLFDLLIADLTKTRRNYSWNLR